MSFLQEIYQVRHAVRTAPKTLEDTKALLGSLVDTVENISQSPKLRTPAIHNQLEQIHRVAKELVHVLRRMEARQRRSRLRQNMYMWFNRESQEGKLEAVLVRLDRAKNDLAIRIQVAHIDLSAKTAIGVQRMEDEVLAGLGSKKHQFRLERNSATGNSKQTNGILGFESTSPPTMASVRDNMSLGGSRQNNLILAGPGSLKFLQGLDL